MSNALRWQSIGIRMLAAAGALAFGACSSTPASRFYTLAPSAPGGSAIHATSATAFGEIRSVNVPAQVARNQMVVRRSDREVDVLENERWASALGDEIRTALSIAVTQSLVRIADRRSPRTGDRPVYWVTVDVQRFESWPDSRVEIDATWRIRRPEDADDRLTCRSTIVEPVARGYDALVDGHRRALVAMAGQIAAGMQALTVTSAAPRMSTTTRSPRAVSSTQCPSPVPDGPMPAPQASSEDMRSPETAF